MTLAKGVKGWIVEYRRIKAEVVGCRTARDVRDKLAGKGGMTPSSASAMHRDGACRRGVRGGGARGFVMRDG